MTPSRVITLRYTNQVSVSVRITTRPATVAGSTDGSTTGTR